MLENQTAFAARIGVSRQCVSGYVRDRKLSGDSLVRQGNRVLIDVEQATKQLRTTLDLDQRLANGKARLKAAAEVEPADDADKLWWVLRQVPALAAWDAATDCGDLQRSYDAFANLRLNITGELRLCFDATPPGEFVAVDWPGLADDFDMTFVDPSTMEADWNRRRLAPDALK